MVVDGETAGKVAAWMPIIDGTTCCAVEGAVVELVPIVDVMAETTGLENFGLDAAIRFGVFVTKGDSPDAVSPPFSIW